MKDVVIVSACRTAVGSFGKSLKDVLPYKLASATMQEAIKRAGIDPGMIDDVRYGCVLEPYHHTPNIARVAALDAGISDTIPAVTLNRLCVSGMEAVISGMAMIKAGLADVILAGGVEHMSSVPYGVTSARWGCRMFTTTFDDFMQESLYGGSKFMPGMEKGPAKEGPVVEAFRGKPYNMAQTAELVGQMYNLTREEMDEVALRSHNNVERATKEGLFEEEIVPVEIPQKKGKPPVIFDKDEHFIPGLTMDRLAALPPVFLAKIGKVTAGNASGVNDGASGLVIMSADKAKELGLQPVARIKAVGYGACHPSCMGLSPVPAVRQLMSRSGLKLEDFELMEINEAFAAQYLGCEKELGLKREIVNINGSGIGMGHPVGSTGSRLIVTLIHAMKKQGKTLGLASLCGGGGVSMATAIEIL